MEREREQSPQKEREQSVTAFQPTNQDCCRLLYEQKSFSFFLLRLYSHPLLTLSSPLHFHSVLCCDFFGKRREKEKKKTIWTRSLDLARSGLDERVCIRRPTWYFQRTVVYNWQRRGAPTQSLPTPSMDRLFNSNDGDVRNSIVPDFLLAVVFFFKRLDTVNST